MFSDEPTYENHEILDNIDIRQTLANKRKFDPADYARIRNQLMGNSCHSNRSKVGAHYNKWLKPVNENLGAKFYQDAKQRVEKFEQQEVDDLDNYVKYDKRKFYPKSN